MKTTKYALGLFFIALGFLGCSNDDDSSESRFAGKIYDHVFYETWQECLDSQIDPEFFYNCHQELQFIDNSKATIMLTDIIYTVDYSIEGDEVILYEGEETLEIPQNLSFDIVNDSTLILLINNTTWRERVGDSPFK